MVSRQGAKKKYRRRNISRRLCDLFASLREINVAVNESIKILIAERTE
jgi:hypothetical protein